MWWICWVAAALAEDLWTTGEVVAKRWADGAQTTVTLAPETKVEVVLRDRDLVRVRYNQDFGWVPAALLTNVAPAKPEGDAGATDLPGVTVRPGEAGQ